MANKLFTTLMQGPAITVTKKTYTFLMRLFIAALLSIVVVGVALEPVLAPK